MAKSAYHMTGDISRDEFDLAIVFMEDENNLYGNWVYGYGFVDVRFPKKKVKELTEDEINKYNGTGFGISGTYYGKLKISEEHVWKR